jgi:hypothetical protein
LARFAERFERPLPDPALPRIVFCGNPRLLEPICRASTRLGGRAWWLGDRLTVRAWLRWRSAGWGQLVCNSSLGRQNRLGLPEIGPIDCRDIDLAPAVTRWISHRIAAQGAQQTRIIEQMDRHFACVRPDALVLDEDQTPLHRIAVAAARRHGARSFVVQHGAPGCRFGFAPLEADCFLAWGESTRGQLRRWAVPAERIAIVGSASHGARRVSRPAPRSPNRGPRILLLATVPPRDQRPDAVVAHLNRTTYREMIRIAASVVSRLPAAELIVKPHPRATDDTTLELALVNAPRVPTRIVRGCSLQSGLAEADCVLSCLSSAGIEATLAGLPVIQLAPPGSGPIFPHDEWGMLGTARSEAELERLLNAALTGDQQLRDGGNPRIFAHADDTTPAAPRIARLVLDAAYERRQTAAFESLESEAPGPSDGADRRSVRAAG